MQKTKKTIPQKIEKKKIRKEDAELAVESLEEEPSSKLFGPTK